MVINIRRHIVINKCNNFINKITNNVNLIELKHFYSKNGLCRFFCRLLLLSDARYRSTFNLMGSYKMPCLFYLMRKNEMEQQKKKNWWQNEDHHILCVWNFDVTCDTIFKREKKCFFFLYWCPSNNSIVYGPKCSPISQVKCNSREWLNDMILRVLPKKNVFFLFLFLNWLVQVHVVLFDVVRIVCAQVF